MKGVGTITSALWVAVAVVALLFFGACSDQKYDLQHTNFRLSSYSNYLEDLGRSSSSSDPLMQALYEGRYPPNISEPANGVERFLIAPDFRVSPFIIRTAEEKQSLDGEEFMVEAIRSRWTAANLTRSDKWLIQYISNGDWYLLASCGPDRRYESEVLGRINRDKKTIAPDELRRRIAGISYDPTNGHDSRGDVTRTSF